MTSLDKRDGSTAGATPDELYNGHIAAEMNLLEALKLEREGWLSADQESIPPELVLPIAYAKQVLADWLKTVQGGTE